MKSRATNKSEMIRTPVARVSIINLFFKLLVLPRQNKFYSK